MSARYAVRNGQGRLHIATPVRAGVYRAECGRTIKGDNLTVFTKWGNARRAWQLSPRCKECDAWSVGH